MSGSGNDLVMGNLLAHPAVDIFRNLVPAHSMALAATLMHVFPREDVAMLPVVVCWVLAMVYVVFYQFSEMEGAKLLKIKVTWVFLSTAFYISYILILYDTHRLLFFGVFFFLYVFTFFLAKHYSESSL